VAALLALVVLPEVVHEHVDKRADVADLLAVELRRRDLQQVRDVLRNLARLA
jgi:hypothetical protein